MSSFVVLHNKVQFSFNAGTVPSFGERHLNKCVLHRFGKGNKKKNLCNSLSVYISDVVLFHYLFGTIQQPPLRQSVTHAILK